LSARLSDPGNADTLLVLVHGLGGSSQSPYLAPATTLAYAAGAAVLRLNLRGADLRGEDFYHAGLSADLHASLQAPELERYRRIALLGFSLGGHVVLRYASEAPAARVGRVATLCAPVDLALGAEAFDSARCALYRGHVLDALKAMYRQVALRRRVPISPEQAERIAGIRQWDENIVAPRHGFGSASEYYAHASAGQHLHRIAVPTLMAFTRDDPIVPLSTLHAALRGRSPSVTPWEIERGGHIGFPAGQAPPGMTAGALGVDEQLTRWLLA
jgi:predicted alpha/beta-fold hydrolase